MRHAGLLGAAVLALSGVHAAHAVDVPIAGLKLIVVDKVNLAGTAKATFVAKDPAVTKGSGTDPTQIQAALNVAYVAYYVGAVSGTFLMPQGAKWVVNKATVAKYVNNTAPINGAVKLSVIKPASLVKVVAKSLGDTALSLVDAPPSSDPVYVMETIVNGGETTRLCTQFPACLLIGIQGGQALKLVCKGGVGDPDCMAATLASTTSTTAPPATTTSTTLP